MTDGELHRLAAIVEQRRQWAHLFREDAWVLDRMATLIQDEQSRRERPTVSSQRHTQGAGST